jgi:hypothetical protein
MENWMIVDCAEHVTDHSAKTSSPEGIQVQGLSWDDLPPHARAFTDERDRLAVATSQARLDPAVEIAHLPCGWLSDAVGSQYGEHHFSRGERLCGRPKHVESVTKQNSTLEHGFPWNVD